MMFRLLPALVITALLAGSCGTDEDKPVLVLAASSLTGAFADMEVAFEQANPGVDVEISYAPSTELRMQLDQGAPADVIAVASEEDMTGLAGEGHVEVPTDFATNRLVIAASRAAAGAITGPESLSDPDLLVGLCEEEVPCGKYALEALAVAGIGPSVDTFENDSRAVTAKLATGELDVGVVYESEVDRSSDDVVIVGALEGADVRYPIAPITDARQPEQAAAFVAFVLSAEGRSIMESSGFGTP